MKRLVAMLLCLMLFAGAAAPAFACRRHRRYRTAYARTYYAAPRRVYYRYPQRVAYAYPPRVYYGYRDNRTFWQKHRDKLTLAMGTGAGAALGGLIGGGKGAGIGALSGLAGSALYTYKLRNRHHYYRY